MLQNIKKYVIMNLDYKMGNYLKGYMDGCTKFNNRR
jgi:hypothetical protein